MIVIGLCGKPPNERYQGGSREVQGGRGSLPCDDDDDEDDDDDAMIQDKHCQRHNGPEG